MTFVKHLPTMTVIVQRHVSSLKSFFDKYLIFFNVLFALKYCNDPRQFGEVESRVVIALASELKTRCFNSRLAQRVFPLSTQLEGTGI